MMMENRLVRLPLNKDEAAKIQYLVETEDTLKAYVARMLFLKGWDEFKEVNKFGIYLSLSDDWIKLKAAAVAAVADFYIKKEIYDEMLEYVKLTGLAKTTIIRMVCIPGLNSIQIPPTGEDK